MEKGALALWRRVRHILAYDRPDPHRRDLHYPLTSVRGGVTSVSHTG